MNIDDFRPMWRGKTIKSISQQHAAWLQPIDIRHASNKRHALLLLHGFSSSPAVYRQLTPHLTPLYDGIVCPALPGHASTITAFANIQSHEWVSAAESAYTELSDTYDSVDIMGLSLGGLLACHLAATFKPRHLYLLAPALALNINAPFALTLAKLLKFLGFKTLRNKAGNIYTFGLTEIAYRQLPITTIIEILTLIREFELQPPTCAVDVFLGKHDEVINSSQVAETFTDMPNATIHWLQDSAHVLPLDGDIDAIIARIRENMPKLSENQSA